MAVASPDGLQLRSKPKISARLNRKAIFALCGVGAGIMLFVMTSIMNSSPSGNAKAAAPEKRHIVSAQAGNEITGAVPDNTPRVVAPPDVPPLEPVASGSPNLPPPKPGQAQQPSQQDQELAQAFRSSTALAEFAAGAPSAPGPGAAARRPGEASDGGGPSAQEPDLNQQAAKREFLERAASDKEPPYRIAQTRPPLSPYEIKTGSIIPATLITAINSDLPGEIVAQVSQNVFDSATGRHLLVPQGTKIFGRYDSSITFGQERLMVAWTRLIYPDASTMDLGGMAGIDKQGQSGFGDQVNNHWMRTFGGAVLMSLFTAGVQASQPQPARGSGEAVTTQQVAAASLGQQLGQLGMAVANRNLRVQPTIEIRRGHKFAVMVGTDLVFPAPYGDKTPDWEKR